MAFKIWELSEYDRDEANNLINTYDFGAVTALLLSSRGISDEAKIKEFFSDEYELIDPFTLPDMEQAVERISTAVELGENICVYGDFDADGVTSTSLLYLYLTELGANVSYYIPNRLSEGYGLNNEAIKKLKSEKDVSLIITVDNGVSAIEEIAYAKSLGIDIVVTDHHMPLEVLPEAVAVVDPHRTDSECEYNCWSGVGVAFKLVCALEGDEEVIIDKYSDLAAIGTIADIVSVLGENRILIKEGLKRINASSRLGVATLRGMVGAFDRELTSNDIAFQIAPRINAAGRMGSADRAVELLTTEDPDTAVRLAEDICLANNERIKAENDIIDFAAEMIRSEGFRDNRVIVICGFDWHPGVLGIVASKLVDKFSKPCVVLSKKTGTNIAVGSCRSVNGFSVFEALNYCSDLLIKFGGHTMAAGLSLNTDNYYDFVDRINEYAYKTSYIMPANTLKIDLKLNPQSIGTGILKELDAFQPFGTDNQSPIFGLYKMTILSINSLSSNKHIKFTLSKNGCTVFALYFGHSTFDIPYEPGDVVNIAVSLERSTYYGKENVSVIIKSIKFAQNEDNLNFEKNIKESFIRDELKKEHYPLVKVDRNDVAVVFRFVRYYNGWPFDLEEMYAKIRPYGLTFTQMLICIDILKEMGLIIEDMSRGRIDVPIEPQKVDLNDSTLLQKSRKLQER